MKKTLVCFALTFMLLFDAVTVFASAAAQPSQSPSVTASPTPTPEVTVTPQPTRTPESTSEPEKTPSSAPWFDNTALIGDSISDGLRLYAIQKRKKSPEFLGDLQFLTRSAYSLSYASSSKPKMLLKYKGESLRPEEALAKMNAKKVFIMLGINDIFHGEAENTEKYNKLIDNIRAKNPNIKICLIAITPIVTEGQYSAFQNTKVNEYNDVVKNVSSGRQCEFANFNDQLRDKTGGLKEEYSRDGFVHLKGGAFEIYAAALEKNAKYMG